MSVLRTDRLGAGPPLAGRVLPVLLTAILAAGGSTALATAGLAAPGEPPRASTGDLRAPLPEGTVRITLTPQPDRVGVGLPITFQVWALSAGKEPTDVTESARV